MVLMVSAKSLGMVFFAAEKGKATAAMSGIKI